MRILKNYKKNRIAPLNLFFLLFVSRTLISFTVSSAVLKSRYSFDLIYSALISLVVTIIVSLPAVIMTSKQKNILDNKILSSLYGAYFIFSGAVNICKFAVFSSTELNENAKIIALAGFMIIACAYAASLGIEAISRFGSMVFVLTLIGIVGVMIEGASEFSLLNIFPITQNQTDNILMNIAFSVCSTNEIVLLIALAPKVNGGVKKPFLISMSAAYAAVMLLIAFAIGILGDTASLSSYPLFEVAQISKMGSGERIEVIFTALWIFAAFLKIALFLYCGAICFGGRSHNMKCAASGLAMFAVSALILYSNAFESNQEAFSYLPFIVFAFVLPLLYLIFGRKKRQVEDI